MENKETMLIILVLVAMLAIIYGGINWDNQNFKTQRYDKCITAMQIAIPDPNDDSRASFLKDCNNQ